MTLLFSKSAAGFYDDRIHAKEQIPSDAVEITQEEHMNLLAYQAAGKVIVGGADGRPIAIDPPPAEPVVPSQVTMRQARLALLAAGKLQEVADAISALPSPDREAAEIEWEFAQTVDRNSEFLLSLSSSLGLTSELLDELFTHASTL